MVNSIHRKLLNAILFYQKVIKRLWKTKSCQKDTGPSRRVSSPWLTVGNLRFKTRRQGSVAGREREVESKEFGPSLPLLRSQRPHRGPDTAGHKWKLASLAQVNWLKIRAKEKEGSILTAEHFRKPAALANDTKLFLHK